MQTTRLLKCFGAVVVTILLFAAAGQVFAGVTASISGTVKDSSGGAVIGAKVTATNPDTGIVSSQATNGDGYYSFQSLALGKYTIEVRQPGFKLYRQIAVVLDQNPACLVHVIRQL